MPIIQPMPYQLFFGGCKNVTKSNFCLRFARMQNVCFTSTPLGGEASHFLRLRIVPHPKNVFLAARTFRRPSNVFSPSGACSTSAVFFSTRTPNALEHLVFSLHLWWCFLSTHKNKHVYITHMFFGDLVFSPHLYLSFEFQRENVFEHPTSTF